jgi:hypothetical protein
MGAGLITGHSFVQAASVALSERRPSRLVATAAENRLTFRRRNPHTSFAAASDCRTIAY